MAGNYPKMLYARDFKSHCDVANHDHERAQRKAASTTLAQDPDDLARKLNEGWREHPDDDFDSDVAVGDPPAVVDVTEPVDPPLVVPAPRRGRRQAEAAQESPVIE